MTVLEIIRRSSEFLEKKGVESPRLNIELMLAHALKLPRLKLYLNFERALSESELNAVREMVKRRGAREPLQHIVGSTSFCGLEIMCSRAALVPRPETELLAERSWQFLNVLPVCNRQKPEPNKEAGSNSGALGSVPARDCQLKTGGTLALDLGTGSGCIAIAIVAHAPEAVVHAVDVSAEALALAKENAEKNASTDRILFHLGDAFAALAPGMEFDLIVSNPPYLASAEIQSLQPEVRDFDPRLALDGGRDGLDFHRRIAREAPAFLKPHGRLMLEFADGQAEEVKKVLVDENWIVDEIVADYSSRPRILIARRRE